MAWAVDRSDARFINHVGSSGFHRVSSVSDTVARRTSPDSGIRHWAVGTVTTNDPVGDHSAAADGHIFSMWVTTAAWTVPGAQAGSGRGPRRLWRAPT